MRNKSLKKAGAAIMAAVLTMSSFSGISVVNAAESTTQTSSEKEMVYVNAYSAAERTQNFDDNWKFYLGSADGAENAAFDDSGWETVNLPHDYSIEQEYTSAGEAESAYLLGGTGWYRKYFTLEDSVKGKEIRIDFGGVYMNATIWVNGTQLGTHPYGYTPFSFDITDYVKFDEENVITVKVEHQTPSSRWYSGSGIYRSVNLTVTDSVHVDLYGTQISTPNLETEKNGTVNMNIDTTVANAGNAAEEVVLVHRIYEKGTENSIGSVTTEASSIAAGESAEISATLQANNPKLWDTENPNLYTVVTEVKVGDIVKDTYETEYGFRYIKFDTETGFYLNGENVKLKGVCMHHDQGSLGSEAHARAIERQVEILKEMGCNSIRVTHNPAAQELIDACNEQGILVIEEVFDGWMYAKNGNTYDYSVWFQKSIEDGNQILGAEDDMTWAEFDLKAVINRGENNPSIIMWSLGNEIQEGAGGSGYSAMADKLIAWAQETDTDKILTIGSNAVKNNVGNSNNEHIQIGNKLTAVGGVSGTNYSNGTSYDNLHSTYPEWYLVGSETASHVNSRGVYYKTTGDTSNLELTSYDNSCVGWGATASSAWYDVITRDFVAGEYVWTGFDYLGEPTPWNGTGSGYVSGTNSPKNSFFGIIDTAGLPKDNYYFYQSQWNDKVNTLHLLPAWNEDVVAKDSSGNVPVVVYSDAASVELFFTADGSTTETSLGRKTFIKKTTDAGYTYQIYEGSDKNSTENKNLYLTWNVPYADGTISAVAYAADGTVITDTVGRSYVTTTGEEAKLETIVDRDTINADGKDLAYITVNVTDAEGNIVPDAANNVSFSVEGDGVLVGVDNGKQSDHQSYQDDNRDAYNGSLIAIVQSTKNAGEFTITASAKGLKSSSATVTTTASADTADIAFLMSKNYYVSAGNKPVLPKTIEMVQADGTTKDVSVVWDDIATESYAKAGTFFVKGTVDEKYSVSVTVNVIDTVGGMLNYSTTTSIGVIPKLPSVRQVIMTDGTVMDAAFAITWDEITESDVANVGTIKVNGIANVFGTEIAVTAYVRVQEDQVNIGDSISDQAAKITQDIDESLQSDTLEAIKDGSISVSNNSEGGKNPSIWSNYANSQTGDNKAELVFSYDTQQRFGEIVIHFVKDEYSAEWPDAGTTEIYISETGNANDWTKLDTKETLGEADGRVKAYTYSFEPTTATYVKFCLTNSTAEKTVISCTAIAEIELKEAVTAAFTANSTAALGSLTVAGVKVSAEDLEKGVYYTSSTAPMVRASGADNASVTVLPENEGMITIIVESEDHKTRETYTIYVGQEAPADASDDSNDISTELMEAISGSQYLPGTSNEGPDDFILDGNGNTHWHTDWSTNDGQDVTKRWIGVSLNEATEIAGIRYLPRQEGNGNGAVLQYEVQYRTTDDGEWIKAAEGTWTKAESGWKLVTFDEAVVAKQVRVVGITTTAESGDNAHMTTAEFRVVKPAEKTEETVIETVRLSGADRNETSLKVANELKAVYGMEKFDAIVVATGKNYADALPGSYLAIAKKAPILLTNGTTKKNQALVDYVKENAAEDAAIYILGGVNAVPAETENMLKAAGFTNIDRLGGADRFETNQMIIDRAGLADQTELFVVTSKDFADSLSVSATGKPILMINPQKELNENQKAILDQFKTGTIYVIGGTSAISEECMSKLADYVGSGATVTRIAGNGRYVTTLEIAKKFFPDAEQAVIAYGHDFPDGLCGGPLAAALNVPMILTRDTSDKAEFYAEQNGIASGYALGGVNVLADETIKSVFYVDEIVEK